MKTTSRILTERNKEGCPLFSFSLPRKVTGETMELVCRGFRQERGPSINSGRSSSSLLISESILPECARIAGYDRLSASMRMRNEPDIGYRSRKSRVCTFISKVFGFRKICSDCETEQPGDTLAREGRSGKKKRSSWLPDPERRWPVQGW
ncbi:hypothetical protein OIU74_004801 [Salix koriyanagi]|uniref:Uncharacterized protein n=1 Tax=Salix koriyanagi TaxID=2511006 RepID=A0A9Q0UML7_9ROSI|nr:hypothetical protein OIU74_004801 [Salix koriyanagi]